MWVVVQESPERAIASVAFRLSLWLEAALMEISQPYVQVFCGSPRLTSSACLAQPLVCIPTSTRGWYPSQRGKGPAESPLPTEVCSCFTQVIPDELLVSPFLLLSILIMGEQQGRGRNLLLWWLFFC